MSFKRFTAATAAIALMTTPVVAAAQSAPSSASSSASAEVAPATESVQDGSMLRGGFIIPLIAIVAIILGILAATSGGKDRPTSP